MLVKNKKYSIMKKLNLEACGLQEMDPQSLVAINGGDGLECWVIAAWYEIKEAASDFADGFSAGWIDGRSENVF